MAQYREATVCSMRLTYLCCLSKKKGKMRVEGSKEHGKGKDLRVPIYLKSAQRTSCCYSWASRLRDMCL